MFKTPGHEFRSQMLKNRAVNIRKFISEKLEENNGDLGRMDASDAAHGDQAISVIRAMVADAKEMHIWNVINNGAVSNLPDSAIVEVSCFVGAHGAIPLAAGAFPKSVYSVVRSQLDHQELTVDAALTGDRNKVVQAAMLHSSVKDLDTLEKVLKEMYEVHKAYLPQFK
ncbi:MAG: hypothetical protein A2452_04550 [Candidatus Firestonebacteria bacterium RIFOXYC2_FULL_39_67]|nr:MAG: hypothetical protein A2452_04550 [Candidatus Firestonebacteria bacterium RIFOXYC2_FULL_39_67]